MKRFNLVWLLSGLLLSQGQAVFANFDGTTSVGAPAELCELPAPQNFTVLNQTPILINFKWDKVTGASQYRFNIRVNGVLQTPIVTPDTALTYFWPPLGQHFEFWVEALCPDGTPGASSFIIKIQRKIDPIITVDEIVQLAPNCQLPGEPQVRLAGLYDEFDLTIPTSGTSEIAFWEITDPAITYIPARVRFILWLDAADQNLHYKTMLLQFGSGITRIPDCSHCTTDAIMFNSQNNPFFKIYTSKQLNSFHVTIYYFQNAQIKTCTAQAHGLQEIQDRNSAENPLPEADSKWPGQIGLWVTPNPLNGPARLLYELPEAGPVQISLFDPYGRRIRNLTERQFAGAGQHELRPDLDDLTPGMYYIQLQTNDRQKTAALIKI